MKKAIVVGATSGIGKALSLLLAANNYTVGITGRRKNLLEELKAQQPKFIIADFDITDTTLVNHHLDLLIQELGGLDLLILSAGIGDDNPSMLFEIEKSTIDVNVSGFTAVANWAFHFFVKQKSGHIAAITSIAGIRANAEAPAYNATKAFQINYLEGLQLKMKQLNLRVCITDIRPGFVDTAMAKAEKKLWMAPVAIAAQQILAAIENKKEVVYVTKRWQLVAFIFGLLPRMLRHRLS